MRSGIVYLNSPIFLSLASLLLLQVRFAVEVTEYFINQAKPLNLEIFSERAPKLPGNDAGVLCIASAGRASVLCVVAGLGLVYILVDVSTLQSTLLGIPRITQKSESLKF
ncbi:hypothetical protein NE237_016767 [Protea cynaroides]|uniref:Uncharacterized protein n=1 Tax=Protea cynaroides TaxID=273540 RepID=A0A9Q0HET0_9MAGN|nr:hypothetical protein NE237_016767 [Protea cynaroides]